jgi:threonine aldolase
VRGVDHDPHGRRAFDLGRHRHRELRNPEQEVGGAVEGVHNPAHCRGAFPGGPFLTQDGIFRAHPGQYVAHGRFGLTVHIRNHVRGRGLGRQSTRCSRPRSHQHGRGGAGGSERHRRQFTEERIRTASRWSENLGHGAGIGPVCEIVVSHPPVVAYGGGVLVDLRSDTVTKPTPEMRRAMADAEVGDDEYAEDPTVNRLQDTYAELTGKEAALFVPSGTMANQVALRTLTKPGDAVVAGRRQHVVVYEEGAGPINAGVTFLTVPDERGVLDVADVERAIESGHHYQPVVTLIAVEDTHMASGGLVWGAAALAGIAELAGRHGVRIHMDGARLWNASISSGRPMDDLARPATTVMSCLSKGLGAPVGSVLAGPADLIEEARLHRKRLGGTMRQAGVIAAAGLVAMKTRFERLAEDHLRARRLAKGIAERWPEAGLDPDSVSTNIVVFAPPDADAVLKHLGAEGIRAGTIAPGILRLVTHADVDDAGIERACLALASAR